MIVFFVSYIIDCIRIIGFMCDFNLFYDVYVNVRGFNVVLDSCNFIFFI